MMFCPSCLCQEPPGEATHCWRCATKLKRLTSGEEAQLVNGDKMQSFCSRCGFPQRRDQDRCSKCGYYSEVVRDGLGLKGGEATGVKNPCKLCAAGRESEDEICGQCGFDAEVGLRKAKEEGELVEEKGGVDPKGAYGREKVPLANIPSTAQQAMSLALLEGSLKYGSFNWRITTIEAMTYVHAATRHLQKWIEGEECDQESLVPHLGSVMACCAILLDSQACGALMDDRPQPRHEGVALRLAEGGKVAKHLYTLIDRERKG